MHTRLSDAVLTPQQIYVFARDQAFFEVLFFSGDRAADLSQVKTAEILRMPDNSGLLFNHIWTKTLRNGDANVFALKRGSNRRVCPVAGLELYFKVTNLVNVDISRGYLFRALSKDGKVSPKQFSAQAAQVRFREYNTQLKNEWKGERFTLHSFREGAAVSLAQANVPLHRIMDHIGWKTSKQALHYIKLREVLNPAGPAAKLANLNPTASERFSQWNTLAGFERAFPPQNAEGK